MSTALQEALARWAEEQGQKPAASAPRPRPKPEPLDAEGLPDAGHAGPEPESPLAVVELPDTWRVDVGDCIESMRGLPPDSIDAIVTDPPYGLGFMGKKWDALPPGVEWAEACLRVLKPGGHLLAFGGTRTYHRLACAIEDAGFEIRDTIAWMYGSGFPKSLDVSKAIDKAAGAEREVVGTKVGQPGYSLAEGPPNAIYGTGLGGSGDPEREAEVTAPATPDAERWNGWGTALKPAHEPIVVARKPLTGTVAANVLEHGTGALNIDGCRVGLNPGYSYPNGPGGNTFTVGEGPDGSRAEPVESQAGRWPANVILDEEAARLLDEQSGERGNHGGAGQYASRSAFGGGIVTPAPNDSGGASRFFYCAKASRKERNAGLGGFEERKRADDGYGSIQQPKLDRAAPRENWQPHKTANHHPTVKPVALMRHLVRLVTPPGGLVLDPFTGSGTTGIAAVLEGFRFLGFEREPEYAEIARARIAHWEKEDA